MVRWCLNQQGRRLKAVGDDVGVFEILITFSKNGALYITVIFSVIIESSVNLIFSKNSHVQILAAPFSRKFSKGEYAIHFIAMFSRTFLFQGSRRSRATKFASLNDNGTNLFVPSRNSKTKSFSGVFCLFESNRFVTGRTGSRRQEHFEVINFYQ